MGIVIRDIKARYSDKGYQSTGIVIRNTNARV